MVAERRHEDYDLLDPIAIDIVRAERRLRHFVRQAWPEVEPGRELVPGFSVDAICDHLQAVAEGEIKRLVITLPPGFLKSTIVSVLFPAWLWIDRPELRFITTSHDSDLAMRDAVRSRRVITSDWYQERWGDRFALTTDQNVKTRYENDRTGHRISLGTGAGITGKRADLVLVDDPHDAEDAYSEAKLAAAVRWWNESVPSRLNDPSDGPMIVIQQRIHVNDLAGEVIGQGYEHLNLPMEYTPTLQVTGIGWRDPRTEAGESLDPVRYGPAQIAEKKQQLGSQAYSAQYQQAPVLSEGGMFKRHWWRFWQPRGATMPPVEVRMPDGSTRHVWADEVPAWWDTSAQSWDMTFKQTQSGSFVVGLVGAMHGPNGYLLDCFRDRLEFTGAVQAVRRMSQRHPNVGAKLIEDKANGPAVIDTLQGEISGIIAIGVDGSKEARAASSTPRVEAGNWLLPHPDLPGAEWVPAFIDELAGFPTGAHDDQVDAFSQLDRYLYRGAGYGWDDIAARMAGRMA